jgi:hypothetical protein
MLISQVLKDASFRPHPAMPAAFDWPDSPPHPLSSWAEASLPYNVLLNNLHSTAQHVHTCKYLLVSVLRAGTGNRSVLLTD